MEHRMSLRIPADYPVTIKPRLSGAINGELRDVSFDGAFLVTKDKRTDSLVRTLVRVRVCGTAVPGVGPVEIPAHVVRAETGGLGLAFDAYDEAVNDYLERVYAERLTRNFRSFSSWTESVVDRTT